MWLNCCSLCSACGSGFVRNKSGTKSWVHAGTRPSVKRASASSRSQLNCNGKTILDLNDAASSACSILLNPVNYKQTFESIV